MTPPGITPRLHPTLRTNQTPRCNCIGLAAHVRDGIAGTGRPICTEHEPDLVAAADRAAEQDRADAELARIRVAHADARAAVLGRPEPLARDWRTDFAAALGTPDTNAGAPLALNDDAGLTAVIAAGLGAPVGTTTQL